MVSGHRDPDLQYLETDAPTIGRLTILTLFQILASRRQKLGWVASAGTITAAFLNGDPLDRELYLRQPRGGVADLQPDQLFRVKKGIFGLPDSPRKWWKKLRCDMMNIKIDYERQSLVHSMPTRPLSFSAARSRVQKTFSLRRRARG